MICEVIPAATSLNHEQKSGQNPEGLYSVKNEAKLLHPVQECTAGQKVQTMLLGRPAAGEPGMRAPLYTLLAPKKAECQKRAEAASASAVAQKATGSQEA
jgi:hypothetical protein